MQRQYLTYLFEGATEYHGKSILENESGRMINKNEFDRIALHIVTTLQGLGINQKIITEIGSLMLKLRSEVT